jgi:GNAT superfamily N-acetyltransferase
MEYFRAVAGIHMAQIQHGILPKLGLDVLGRLYRELSAAPQTGVWVAVHDKRIVGFVSGCANVKRSYRWVLSRPGFLVFLIPTILKVWRLGVGRLISPLTYLGRAKEAVHDGGQSAEAELLAIGVDPAMRGRGLGTHLVTQLEKEFRRWGRVSVYRVSTNLADPDSNRFYVSRGFVALGTVSHHDLVLQVYRKQILETGGIN